MIPQIQPENSRTEIPAPGQFRLSELMALITLLCVVMPFTWRLAGYFTAYRQDLGVLVASVAIFMILYGPIMATMTGTLFSRNMGGRKLFWGFVLAGWGLSYLVMIGLHCLH